MGAPSVGDVVIIRFPYSGLSQSKRRPALVLAGVGMGVIFFFVKSPASNMMTHTPYR